MTQFSTGCEIGDFWGSSKLGMPAIGGESSNSGCERIIRSLFAVSHLWE